MNGLRHYLIRLHAQLVLHMDWAGGDKSVNTPGVSALKRFGGTLDVRVQGARQAADGAVFDVVGNRLNRSEVARAGDGKASLDHVNAQTLQRLSDTQLFFAGHGRTWALLAIAQSGIENNDAVVAAHAGFLTDAQKHRPGIGACVVKVDCRVKRRGREAQRRLYCP